VLESDAELESDGLEVGVAAEGFAEAGDGAVELLEFDVGAAEGDPGLGDGGRGAGGGFPEGEGELVLAAVGGDVAQDVECEAGVGRRVDERVLGGLRGGVEVPGRRGGVRLPRSVREAGRSWWAEYRLAGDAEQHWTRDQTLWAGACNIVSQCSMLAKGYMGF
jgi:hypothetical protein